MKKLILILSIVSLFLACNNGGSGGNMETKKEEQETKEQEVIVPKPVTYIRHEKNGDVYTVYFEHDGVGVNRFHASVYCTNGVSADQKNYDYPDKDAREYSFNYAELEKISPCPHKPKCKEIYVSIFPEFLAGTPHSDYKITLE